MMIKPHHLLVALLVAATVSLDLFVNSTNVDRSAIVLVMALGFSQIALLSAWIVWGRSNPVLRLAVLLAAIVAWASPMSSWNGQPAVQWMSALMFFAVMVMGPLLVMRAGGKHLTAPFLEEIPRRHGRQRWQFSIWSLLCCMTAVALVLGFGRMLRFPWQFAFEIAILCGSFALVAVVALVAALQCRRGIVPLIVSAVVCLAMGGVLAMLGGKANYTLIFAIEATLIALSVTVVRVGQYRLENTKAVITHWRTSSAMHR